MTEHPYPCHVAQSLHQGRETSAEDAARLLLSWILLRPALALCFGIYRFYETTVSSARRGANKAASESLVLTKSRLKPVVVTNWSTYVDLLYLECRHVILHCIRRIEFASKHKLILEFVMQIPSCLRPASRQSTRYKCVACEAKPHDCPTLFWQSPRSSDGQDIVPG